MSRRQPPSGRAGHRHVAGRRLAVPADAQGARPRRAASPPGDGSSLDGEADRALDALLDQAAVALERAELMEERARGEARAETETLRTALLTSLGHDLKTPLTSVRGAIGTLRASGTSLPEATCADLLATAEEAERLSRWITNTLDIVCIENRQAEPTRETVDLSEVVEFAAPRAARAHGREVAPDLQAGTVLPRPDLRFSIRSWPIRSTTR